MKISITFLSQRKTINKFGLQNIPKKIQILKYFQACLKTGACSCFQGLEEAGAECEDFLTLENQIKAEKNDCINPDKKGSFGNCRQEERLATTFTVDCCASYAVTTLVCNDPYQSNPHMITKAKNMMKWDSCLSSFVTSF